MRVLVSVRDVAEARQAARAGVHFVDLKEPARGALGGLDLSDIDQIASTLRREAPGALLSATIGDWPAEALGAISDRVRAVAALGVDYVKVGVLPGPGAAALLRRLGELGAEGLPLVPVLIADDGVPWTCLESALQGNFPALMLDTANKRVGSLLDRAGDEELAMFIGRVRAAGALAGLAGALRLDSWDRLGKLAPDFAGFRSAVCLKDRAGQLDAACLARLMRRDPTDTLHT